MPTAIFIIINAPTATELIPSDCVIGMIMGQVSNMMDVGSMRHPRINSRILITVRRAILLLNPASTASAMVFARPLLDTNQAMAVATQTMVSMELTRTLISQRLRQICFADRFL